MVILSSFSELPNRWSRKQQTYPEPAIKSPHPRKVGTHRDFNQRMSENNFSMGTIFKSTYIRSCVGPRCRLWCCLNSPTKARQRRCSRISSDFGQKQTLNWGGDVKSTMPMSCEREEYAGIARKAACCSWIYAHGYDIEFTANSQTSQSEALANSLWGIPMNNGKF